MWRLIRDRNRDQAETLKTATDGRRPCGLLRRFVSDRSGSVAIYSVFMVALLLGAGVLAIDFGRMVAVRHEMQNMADAAALSAARYLDGQSGARLKAVVVANTAIEDISRLADASGITVSEVLILQFI